MEAGRGDLSASVLKPTGHKTIRRQVDDDRIKLREGIGNDAKIFRQPVYSTAVRWLERPRLSSDKVKKVQK